MVGTFSWAGFGVRPDMGCFQTLWRGDSRAFAIWYEQARGWTSFDVYADNGQRWSKLEVPALYPILARRHAPWVHRELEGKGGEIPTAWLPGGKLQVQAQYRAIPRIGGAQAEDREEVFRVVLGVARPLP